ncbi:hypothetical protein GOD97_01025 [Paeniclostridium sordellii]|uniref:hypothetical protein n=1 Tax=Paraclostridium sordellii TaxID=1505 RepID=UPI0012EE58FA|nr:hypothetical protein [Paeniclostridium sordellii]MVO73315.1 hypothetical protein [Paeniclostridium sordellii]
MKTIRKEISKSDFQNIPIAIAGISLGKRRRKKEKGEKKRGRGRKKEGKEERKEEGEERRRGERVGRGRER